MVDPKYLGDILDLYKEIERIADKHEIYPEYIMRDVSNYHLCGTVCGEKVATRY